MRHDKAAGQSGVLSEMLKASERSRPVDRFMQQCKTRKENTRRLARTILVPVYKGNGNPHECGSYRSIKLLEHGMKVLASA